ncbi:hypothetical protein B0H14DRAFT_1695839 [Mycena olivaceomarginata]|nr:hypothetical protein B0H14DRAFT_1695839 [Mycena olivaceomarginata]
MTTSLFSTRRSHTRPRIRKALERRSHRLALSSPPDVARAHPPPASDPFSRVSSSSSPSSHGAPHVRAISRRHRWHRSTFGFAVDGKMCCTRWGSKPDRRIRPFHLEGCQQRWCDVSPRFPGCSIATDRPLGLSPPTTCATMPFSLANRLEWDPIVANAARTSAHWGFHPHRVSHPSASAAHPQFPASDVVPTFPFVGAFDPDDTNMPPDFSCLMRTTALHSSSTAISPSCFRLWPPT